jgi:hypothetical protein
MEIDIGEVDLVFGFCVFYTKNPEQRRAQQLVIHIDWLLAPPTTMV